MPFLPVAISKGTCRLVKPLLFGFAPFVIGVPAGHSALPPQIDGFVKSYCIDCHDADMKKGGLDLSALGFGAGEEAHATWVRVFDQVVTGQMPPADKPKPGDAAKQDFATVLGQGLNTQHMTMKGTVLRRLNRTEYENTLRDLLGMRVEVRDLLPEDSLSHGFDNIGDSLSMSDVQLARYMEAAEFALNTALQQVTKPETAKVVTDYQFKKPGMKPGGRAGSWLQKDDDNAVVFFNNGIEPDTQLKSFRAPTEGMYRFRINGYAYQSPEPVAFAVHSGPNGKRPVDLLGYYELAPGSVNTVTIDTWLRTDETIKISPMIGVSLDKFREAGGPSKYPGPGLAIHGVEVEGPIFETWPPKGVALLFGDLAKTGKETDEKAFRASGQTMRPLVEVTSTNPSFDAARQLRGFAAAAFRRPVNEAKVAPYIALFNDELKRGSSFSVAMRTAAIGILCSPDFLYLKEPSGVLDDYSLASRMSYFLWRSAPDDTLLQVAQTGKLREPAILYAQTERLLAHPHAKRFVADFTDAWLNLREIEATSPDRKLYPEFNGQLQDAMVAESRAFFLELIKSNLSPSNIVQSDFAMLNSRLAEHYGIPDVKGVEMRKVALTPDSKRGGVLTQGAVLKVTSNGTNTSPVVRGAYVLDRILGSPPQPPPPGVPGLEPDVRGALTLREQLQQHRSIESCNSCHKDIDPPGFALENYDVIGGFREKFRSTRRQKGKINLLNGPPVDSTGELANGTKFAGFQEFQKLLMIRPDRVTRTIAEKLLTFSTGRELGFSDRTEVIRIVNDLSARKGGMKDLVHFVVRSQIFQTE